MTTVLSSFDNLSVNYSAPIGNIAINPSVCESLCLSVCLSVHEHISETAGPIGMKFGVQIPVAVALFSSGGVVLRYVLPVIWMTSRLVVMGATPSRVDSSQRRRSITCVTGAESDVYECLVLLVKLTPSVMACLLIVFIVNFVSIYKQSFTKNLRICLRNVVPVASLLPPSARH